MAALARIKGAARSPPCSQTIAMRSSGTLAVATLCGGEASGQSAPRHGLLLSSLAAAPRAGRVDLPAWLGRRSGRPCSCHVRSRRNDRRGHSPRRYREVANSQLPSSCDDTLFPGITNGQRNARLCARTIASWQPPGDCRRDTVRHGKGHLPLPCVGAVTFDDFRDRVLAGYGLAVGPTVPRAAHGLDNDEEWTYRRSSTAAGTVAS